LLYLHYKVAEFNDDHLKTVRINANFLHFKLHTNIIHYIINLIIEELDVSAVSYLKPLGPTVFAVVSTHHSALGMMGYGPFSFCVIHKEGLCPSSGEINS
jgi:hypothetical protein